VLLVHGERDESIPVSHAAALHAAARDPPRARPLAVTTTASVLAAAAGVPARERAARSQRWVISTPIQLAGGEDAIPRRSRPTGSLGSNGGYVAAIAAPPGWKPPRAARGLQLSVPGGRSLRPAQVRVEARAGGALPRRSPSRSSKPVGACSARRSGPSARWTDSRTTPRVRRRFPRRKTCSRSRTWSLRATRPHTPSGEISSGARSTGLLRKAACPPIRSCAAGTASGRALVSRIPSSTPRAP
jgi:hypothetical protein